MQPGVKNKLKKKSNKNVFFMSIATFPAIRACIVSGWIGYKLSLLISVLWPENKTLSIYMIKFFSFDT